MYVHATELSIHINRVVNTHTATAHAPPALWEGLDYLGRVQCQGHEYHHT